MKTPPARLLDLLAALGVLCIVGSLLVPLPLPVLDLLLTLNLGLSLLLLATALLLTDPLRLSSFPTLLLVSTLFRLALNVSSTRQILGRGEAGEIIEAFGAFVIGGSHIVGAVIFVILTVIQLVVVAKGAERVAEVGARFTLDGLPGKQLSIDADIRSGGCTQAEGAQRRRLLEEESRFYGALDGAMKFVKGDAVAGILITAINIVGGLGVGMGLHGLGLAEAAGRFTLLSIGDGLVSQLPALLSSVAAGIVVTRVARSGSGGGSAGELVRQLADDPRALGLAASILFLLGLVPGLPVLPFLTVAGFLSGVALFVHRRQQAADSAPPLEGEVSDPRVAETSSETPAPSPPAHGRAAALVLELDLASEDPELESLRRELLPALRRDLESRLGVAPPPIALRRGPPGHFRLLLHGAVLREGSLPVGNLLLAHPDEARLLRIEGEAREFEGRPALEIDDEGKALALRCGLQVYEPLQLLSRALHQALAQCAAEWLTLQQCTALVEALEPRAPSLVEELRSRIGPSILHRVLQILLEEGVPLRPFDRLLEALLLVDSARLTTDGVEAIRRALGRQLVQPRLEAGVLSVLLLDPLTDARLRESLCPVGEEIVLALHPREQSELLEQLGASGGRGPMVLLVATELRRALSHLVRSNLEARRSVEVLSFEELPPDLALRPLGRLELPDLGAPLQPVELSPGSPSEVMPAA